MSPEKGAASACSAVLVTPKASTTGVRALRVLTRSLHIPAVALVLGPWVLGAPELVPRWAWHAAAWTGIGLGLLFFRQSLVWWLELRGLLIALKVGALLALPWCSQPVGAALLLAVAVTAGISSHMPGRFRHLRIDRWLRAR